MLTAGECLSTDLGSTRPDHLVFMMVDAGALVQLVSKHAYFSLPDDLVGVLIRTSYHSLNGLADRGSTGIDVTCAGDVIHDRNFKKPITRTPSFKWNSSNMQDPDCKVWAVYAQP